MLLEATADLGSPLGNTALLVSRKRVIDIQSTCRRLVCLLLKSFGKSRHCSAISNVFLKLGWTHWERKTPRLPKSVLFDICSRAVRHGQSVSTAVVVVKRQIQPSSLGGNLDHPLAPGACSLDLALVQSLQGRTRIERFLPFGVQTVQLLSRDPFAPGFGAKTSLLLFCVLFVPEMRAWRAASPKTKMTRRLGPRPPAILRPQDTNLGCRQPGPCLA